jgi:dihydropteroate synthase
MKLVGILNVTPDSFSDGGKFFSLEKALKQAEKLFKDGADLIDIGAESTNPKSTPLSADEEWARLEKLLPQLLEKYPDKISLDSYHPETVENAAQIAPIIVNDVTSFSDPESMRIAADYNLTCIISHLPHHFGSDIQAAHQAKPVDSINQVIDELLTRRDELAELGLSYEQIILDPGIGFGKTMRLNWKLLEFAKFIDDHRVMIGHSRKRFLGTSPQSGAPLTDGDKLRFSDEVNLIAAKIAKDSGAAYLRVHDPAIYRSIL